MSRFLISTFKITELDWSNVRTLSAIWRDIREIKGSLNSWYTCIKYNNNSNEVRNNLPGVFYLLEGIAHRSDFRNFDLGHDFRSFFQSE
jgi:hypothetical protein